MFFNTSVNCLFQVALEGRSSIFLQHTCPLSQRIPACWGRYLPNLELKKMHVAF